MFSQCAKDSEIDLLTLQKHINVQSMFIPATATDWRIADLPLSKELIHKLIFFKFFKLGELNLIPYRKMLKKFLKVNLTSRNLIVELYVFLTAAETFSPGAIPANSDVKDKDSNDEFENFVKRTIHISSRNQDCLINSLFISIRLQNVLQLLDIEKLVDLQGMSFQRFFAINLKLLLRSIKRAKTVTFETLCEEYGVKYDRETAHK